MSLNASNTWIISLGNLFTRRLPKEIGTFAVAMENAYKYVKAGNDGKSTSKSIHIDEKRWQMIKELFISYEKDEGIEALCKSNYLRKMVKHNESNTIHLEYISSTLVPQFFNIMQIPNTMNSSDKNILQNWVKHLVATVGEAAYISEQKVITEVLPKEKQDFLALERSKIGKNTIDAVAEGWIQKRDLLFIRAVVLGEKKISDLNESNDLKIGMIESLTNQFLKLIEEGGEYSEIFRTSLASSLDRYSRDPTVQN